MIINSLFQYQKALDRDMQLDNWCFLNFSLISSEEIINIFCYFYYINRRFSADKNSINLLRGISTDFIQNSNQILPLYLYERFRGGKSHGLVCTQFLCALNIQLGYDSNLLKDAMNIQSTKKVTKNTVKCFQNLWYRHEYQIYSSK